SASAWPASTRQRWRRVCCPCCHVRSRASVRPARAGRVPPCSLTETGAVLSPPGMPIYEYRCDRCGVFETTQRITDPALEKCPTCNKKVRRLISATSFQLKGSGWYVTDYARKGSGAASKDAGATTSSGDTGSSASDKSGDKSEKTGSETAASTKADSKSASK